MVKTGIMVISLVLSSSLMSAGVVLEVTHKPNTSMYLQLRTKTQQSVNDDTAVIAAHQQDKIDTLISDDQTGKDDRKILHEQLYQLQLAQDHLTTVINIIGALCGLALTAGVGFLAVFRIKRVTT